jgi:hypothetical protein
VGVGIGGNLPPRGYDIGGGSTAQYTNGGESRIYHLWWQIPTRNLRPPKAIRIIPVEPMLAPDELWASFSFFENESGKWRTALQLPFNNTETSINGSATRNWKEVQLYREGVTVNTPGASLHIWGNGRTHPDGSDFRLERLDCVP